MEPIKLKCDMMQTCTRPVAYVDHSGFVYCAQCGERRKTYTPCRKLRKKELETIASGQPIKFYGRQR